MSSEPARGSEAQKPCHNCRRRRLRCDRSRPRCNKCAASGHECEGYGTGVRRWVDGVAVRGKMAGRTFGEADSPGLAAAISAAAAHPSHDSNDGTLPRLVRTLTDPIFQDLDHWSRLYLAHFANHMCQYLVACDRPDPASNPFRELVPLALATPEHAFLLHILIATSALHLSNIWRPRPATSLASLRKSASAFDSGGDLVVSFPIREAGSHDLSRRAFMDALIAKQQAIRHMRTALEMIETTVAVGGELLLAAALFFINFELIDFGKSGWRAHLAGASRIMMALLSAGASVASGKTVSSKLLRDSVLSECFIYHVLGSTLNSPRLASSIAHHVIDLLPVVERAEANSYLCCPPALLEIMLCASQLSDSGSGSEPQSSLTPSPTTMAALDLIRRAWDFDIHAWLIRLQERISDPHICSRSHVASAHRSAAILYILQAVPSVRGCAAHGFTWRINSDTSSSIPSAPILITPDALVSSILRHLAFVNEFDPHFKATSWPTFICGAESTDPKVRAWTLERLRALWEICSWGYILTAMETLRATWEERDRSAERPGGTQNAAGYTDDSVMGLRRGWLLELREKGFDCLVV